MLAGNDVENLSPSDSHWFLVFTLAFETWHSYLRGLLMLGSRIEPFQGLLHLLVLADRGLQLKKRLHLKWRKSWLFNFHRNVHSEQFLKTSSSMCLFVQVIMYMFTYGYGQTHYNRPIPLKNGGANNDRGSLKDGVRLLWNIGAPKRYRFFYSW